MIHLPESMTNYCVTCPYRDNEAAQVRRGDRWEAYHGDALLVLRDMAKQAPQSVDAIITDPPYGTGANSIAGRLRSTSYKYRSTGAASLPDFAGDSMLPDVWQEMIAGVMAYSLQIAKPGAPALVFCDWRGYPMLMRLVGSVGWCIRGLLVWDKGRGSRPSRNGFRAQSELILWARKGNAIDDRDHPVYLDGVFRHATLKSKRHITEKPVALMRELVEICPPGGTVLDPFQGSGTTGVAALMTGRRYIGIEKVEDYHNIACERLGAAMTESSHG